MEGTRQRAESLQCSLDKLEGELERARQQVRTTLQDAAQVEADRDVALAMQRDVAANLNLANSRLEEAAQTHNLQLERAVAEAKEAAEVAARDRGAVDTGNDDAKYAVGLVPQAMWTAATGILFLTHNQGTSATGRRLPSVSVLV